MKRAAASRVGLGLRELRAEHAHDLQCRRLGAAFKRDEGALGAEVRGRAYRQLPQLAAIKECPRGREHAQEDGIGTAHRLDQRADVF